MQKLVFKNKLKEFCCSTIEARILAARIAIEAAQQAANFEEKSSAGDKYETSRAMGHLEKEMHSSQLAAHLKDLASLHSINFSTICIAPVAGAYVHCSTVSFFIACGLGKQLVSGNTIVFLSPYAPLAKSLYHKKLGDSISFNAAENIIEDIY